MTDVVATKPGQQLFALECAYRRPILLLSIRRLNAERIFAGSKEFELRKSLPKARFGRVYLYESGGGGIVGCFDPGHIIRLPIEQLWHAVGEKATTRASFETYFEGWRQGYAIGVMKPVQFLHPILPAELRERIPEFAAPQSYSLVPYGDPLFTALEHLRGRQIGLPHVTLAPIADGVEAEYKEIVTREISARYDEIKPAFADMIISAHRQGKDPNGLFTLRKEVLSIFNRDGEMIGFTTLTYKVSGCVKTGPTVILPQFRGQGFGLSARRAVEVRMRIEGIRKLYCTCPDSDPIIVRHLLSASWRIEAHLTTQYTERNGELVFGKSLSPQQPVEKRSIPRSDAMLRTIQLGVGDVKDAARSLQSLYTQAWCRHDLAFFEGLLATALRNEPKTFEKKPVRMAALGIGGKAKAFALIIPKRGGAARAILLSESGNTRSLITLIKQAEGLAVQSGCRKLYTVQPLGDDRLIGMLLKRTYRAEGVLDAPYAEGIQGLVLSRFLGNS